MQSSSTFEEAMQSWNRLLQVLAKRQCRTIVFSLLSTDPTEQVPLPESAMIPGEPVDPAQLTVDLQHNYLPTMADAAYIRWSNDPFTVQRGPRFDEPATVIRLFVDNADEFPSTLWNEELTEKVVTEP